MKRAFTCVVLIAMVGAAFNVAPAEAGKKKKSKRIERVVEWKYEAPAIGTADNDGAGVCLRPTNSCIDIATGPDDKFIQVEAIDATGTAIAVQIGQDTDPDALGTEHQVGVVCGKSTEALPLQPGAPIVGFPWAFGGVTCPGGFATNGTIKATLSNMP